MRLFFANIFVGHLSVGMMVPMVVLWQLERGLSLGQIAWITSMWWFAVLLLEVPTGIIADRFGRKVSIALSAFCFVIGFGYTGFASTFVQFAIAKVITGLAFTLVSGADEAYVFDWLKERGRESTYKAVWSRVYVVDEIATIIGMALSGAIVWFFGLQTVFFVGSGVMLGSIVLSLALPETRHTRNPDNAQEAIESAPLKVFANAWQLMKRYHFLAWAFGVFALVNFPAKLLWESQMINVGLLVAYVGIAYACMKPFSILGSVVAGRHTGSVHGRHFAGIAFAMAVCFALVAHSTLWSLLLGLGLYFFFENIFRIFKSEYINQRVESENRATILSVSSFAMSIFGAVVVVPVGYLGDFSLVWAFLAMAALKIVAGLISLARLRQ